jgi:hypothetical protein
MFMNNVFRIGRLKFHSGGSLGCFPILALTRPHIPASRNRLPDSLSFEIQLIQVAVLFQQLQLGTLDAFGVSDLVLFFRFTEKDPVKIAVYTLHFRPKYILIQSSIVMIFL